MSLSPRSESTPAQINDQEYPLIQDFLDARTALIEAARAEYNRGAASDDFDPRNECVFVSATNETHAVDFRIDPKIIAGSGLWHRVKSRLARPPRSLWATISELPSASHNVTSSTPPSMESLELSFDCVPNGRQMLDPTIQGIILPGATAPASGNLDDVLDALTNDIINQLEEPDYLPNTPENDTTLRSAVQAYITLAHDPNTRIDFGLPQASWIDSKRATRLTEELMRIHPELAPSQPRDIWTGNLFGERVFATFPSATDHQTTISFSRFNITAKLNLGNQTGGFPSIVQLEWPSAEHQDAQQPIIHIKDREGKPLTLSRANRRMITDIASEAICNQEFIEQLTEQDAIKPTETLLAACHRLVENGSYEFYYAYPEEGQVHVKLRHDSETGAFALITSRGAIHTFNADGISLTSFKSAQEVLQLYALLEEHAGRNR